MPIIPHEKMGHFLRRSLICWLRNDARLSARPVGTRLPTGDEQTLLQRVKASQRRDSDGCVDAFGKRYKSLAISEKFLDKFS